LLKHPFVHSSIQIHSTHRLADKIQARAQANLVRRGAAQAARVDQDNAIHSVDPSAPPPEEENEGTMEPLDDEHCCIICMERPNLFAFLPCGHKVVCGDCGQRWIQQTPSCPICRASTMECVRVFADGQWLGGQQQANSPGASSGNGSAQAVSATHVVTAPEVDGRPLRDIPVPSAPDEEARFVLVEFPLVNVFFPKIKAPAIPTSKQDLKPATHRARNQMERVRSEFYRANTRDVHQDYNEWETVRLPGGETFKERVVLCKGDYLPGWVSRGAYSLWTVFGLACCFRMKLLNAARKEKWWVTKLWTPDYGQSGW